MPQNNKSDSLLIAQLLSSKTTAVPVLLQMCTWPLNSSFIFDTNIDAMPTRELPMSSDTKFCEKLHFSTSTIDKNPSCAVFCILTANAAPMLASLLPNTLLSRDKIGDTATLSTRLHSLRTYKPPPMLAVLLLNQVSFTITIFPVDIDSGN